MRTLALLLLAAVGLAGCMVVPVAEPVGFTPHHHHHGHHHRQHRGRR